MLKVPGPRVLLLGLLPLLLVPTCAATYLAAPDTSLQVNRVSAAHWPGPPVCNLLVFCDLPFLDQCHAL